jgi:hypothetical protein
MRSNLMKSHSFARDHFAAGISFFVVEEYGFIHESMGYLIDMRKIPEDSNFDLLELGKGREH